MEVVSAMASVLLVIGLSDLLVGKLVWLLFPPLASPTASDNKGQWRCALFFQG